MPDFSLERAAGGRVAGVDEAGRGPWAGPVVAAAAILDPARLPADLAGAIDDSKALSRARREALLPRLLAVARFGLGAASVAEIDRLNILAATMLAMHRAVAALDEPGDGPLDLVLVDGNRAPGLDVPVRCVVRGDATSLSIAAASIAAKVTRDRLMARLARRWPGFGWERNAGYGTRAHADGLARQGVTPHHRRSFAPVARLLESPGPTP